MKNLLAGFGLLFSLSVSAQLDPVAIGEWRIHLPLNNAKDVVKVDQKIYCAFANGILLYDYEDGSNEIISKVNGLSSINITQIEYEPVSDVVVVGYSDGNLDLISSAGEVYNMSDIKRSNIVGDKTIYNLAAFNNYMYISTGFGIVVLDAVSKEIKDTYIFGPGGTNIKVFACDHDNDSLYAATEEGVYAADISNLFLSNYQNWYKSTSLPSNAVNGPITDIKIFNNERFIIHQVSGYNNDSAYYFNGAWQAFSTDINSDYTRIKTQNNKLFLIGNGFIKIYDNSLTELINIWAYTFGSIDAADCIFDPVNNLTFIADKQYGLVQAVNAWNNTKLSPPSPFSSASAHIDAFDGNIWISHDGFAGSNGLNTYSTNCFSGVYDGKWKNFNRSTEPLIAGDSVFDAVSVIIDPKDKDHVFAGTYSYKGLFEFKDGEIINVFDETNSSLVSAGIQGYNSVSVFDFDEDQNLWMINSKSTRPLAVKTKAGEWYNYDFNYFKNQNIYDLDVASTGLIWIAAPTGNSPGGLVVFDNRGTLDDPSDDRSYKYANGAGYGNLPSQDVKCVKEDLDEEVWVGTANGLAVIYSQSAAFDGNNFDAQQILIEQDGNVQILFENEVITDIEVDGANRKWIATEGSGAFLMSEDGQEQILHLTAENSPVLANIIYDIAIDPVTGDVYFATPDGIVSLRYTATGSLNAYNDVYAFPNPVASEYEGIIAVKGLSRDSDFKVTDVSGNLVFHGTSLGGQAIWDLKDLKGNRVATGVYLIYCNSENGNKDAVAKLLVIN